VTNSVAKSVPFIVAIHTLSLRKCQNGAKTKVCDTHIVRAIAAAVQEHHEIAVSHVTVRARANA